MRNPFITDRPLADYDLFFGREANFSQVKQMLDEGSRLILVFAGHRGGKTSFLNQLALRAPQDQTVHIVDAPAAVERARDPLNVLLSAIASGLSTEMPSLHGLRGERETYVETFLRLIPDKPSPTLVCLDGLTSGDLVLGNRGNDLQMLSTALERKQSVALLVTIEGHPADLDPSADWPPQILLDPLSVDETDDLLATMTRGKLAFDWDSVRKIHFLSGGAPYLVQMFGSRLFAKRANAGWVGLPEVDAVLDDVVEHGAPQFEHAWQACDAKSQIVLCSFAEMLGHHGMASIADTERHLAQANTQISPEETAKAFELLTSKGLLDQLGGNVARFQSELFRYWLKQHHTLEEVAKSHRRYRRPHVPEPTSLTKQRVDWLTVLLWVVAGAFVVAIALVWQSREGGVVWINQPTPVSPAEARGTVTPALAELPTPESGVAPGHIAYISKENTDDTWEIFSMRSDGSDPVQLTRNDANDTSPVWSRDGRRIAFVSDRDGNREVYVMNSDGNEQINLTRDTAEDWTPAWSPDGQSIAFASFRDGNWEIYVMAADGSDQRRLTNNPAADYGPCWSNDGTRISFVSNRDGNLDIYVMAADGTQPTRFTLDVATDEGAVWASDDSMLAWASYRDDNMEIYVSSLDGSDMRSISQDAYADDHSPTWSPWGQQLAFSSNREGGWDIYTISVETGERANLTLSEAIEQAPHWGP